MQAGDFRHRITIQGLQAAQNAETGEETFAWVEAWSKVPAKFEYLEGRELLAAQAIQSEITARITIRYRPGVQATMRALYRGRVWNFAEPVPDSSSGIQALVIPVSSGVNNG